jgi:hypothetical protein
MPRSTRSINLETARFHQTVEHGSLSELEAALKRGADVNAPGRNGSTALMVAIAARDLAKMMVLAQHGADLERTDDFNQTALGHAVSFDFEEGVQYLLSKGVDRGYHPKYPLKKITYDESLPEPKMPAELKNVMSEAEWQQALAQTRESMRELGENPTAEPLIRDIQSVAVLRLFLEAGDDLNLAPTEVKRALLGLETGGVLRCTSNDYRAQKTPRYGTRNAEPMDFVFWREMVRTGVGAYAARKQFQDTSLEESGAVWCYNRFGSSLTQLDDGRFVQIGGEHEDFYDPDFIIYNDVVIHDGRGDFQIYGYPREVFPPTDFHTATLCGECIFIVGCLGYPEQRRAGTTPVYRLTLETWEIVAVATTGEPPGWIHRHRAQYDPQRNSLRITGGEVQVAGDNGDLAMVPNDAEFELDLSTQTWRQTK